MSGLLNLVFLLNLVLKIQLRYVFNRHGVAVAVLQTAPSLQCTD